MLNFVNDYCEGAHPKILERLIENNFNKMTGYGLDEICESAASKIKIACDAPDAEVYFLSGGTQTNLVVVDTMTYAAEGVLAAVSGHVSVHEAGAIEKTGHKVLTLPSHDGKVDAVELKDYIETFYGDGNHEHMVFPGLLYISHPTELGTLYTKQELTDISTVCRAYDIPLYLDGARLGYGLMADDTDLTLKDIAALTDVFYIGGTKVGALYGEALVFTHNNMPRRFATLVKQHGAMMAKGWLLGLQFDTLFTDDLYLKIGKNAIEMSKPIKQAFIDYGYNVYIDSPTNQMYISLSNSEMEELAKYVNFSFWEKVDDDHTAIRFVTSWATTQEDVDELVKVLEKCSPANK